MHNLNVWEAWEIEKFQNLSSIFDASVNHKKRNIEQSPNESKNLTECFWVGLVNNFIMLTAINLRIVIV